MIRGNYLFSVKSLCRIGGLVKCFFGAGGFAEWKKVCIFAKILKGLLYDFVC
jgi:hypothetical protein